MKSRLLIALLSICATFSFTSNIEAKDESKSIDSFCVLGATHLLGEKEKTYCSPFAKTKYKLLINKNKVRITRLYKEYRDVFTGVIKKGRIYSNDPNEKNFKPAWGKLYQLEKGRFGVMNIENGDYEWFSECKE